MKKLVQTTLFNQHNDRFIKKIKDSPPLGSKITIMLWNINGIGVKLRRKDKHFFDYLQTGFDIFCFNETKLTLEKFN